MAQSERLTPYPRFAELEQVEREIAEPVGEVTV